MHSVVNDEYIEPRSLKYWLSPVRILLGGILLTVALLSVYLLGNMGLDPVYYVALGWIGLVIMALWGGNAAIGKFMDRIMPWESYATRRFFSQLICSVLFSLVCINATYYFFKIGFTEFPPDAEQIVVLNIYGSLFLVPVISLHFGIYFLTKWKRAFMQAENLKQETVKSQLDSLRNHIDPHFLFNNLNILSSLIPKESKEANEFLENFSDVYRYVLQHRKSELVKVETEIEFIEAYAFMLSKRFGNHFSVEIDLNDKVLTRKFIPPLALQLLVENVVKHNVISAQKPLSVQITHEEHEYLVIRNNLQRKTTLESYSSRSGLDNIMKRYRYLCEKQPEIIESHDSYTVRLPLLNLGMF